ncbi:MAG: cytochrome c biogenesis CcdA family protein [Desulforhopalus sp.]|jgi:cytochrome c-type biogenesis protein|nr:cytochrome c biogenesis CcdA family protein [Desulforhopalus sp.]
MAPLDLTLASLLMALLAGLASIASPCVLPVVPIIVTGTRDDHRHRPLLIVLGLSATFIAMGVITAIFGGVVAGVMPLVEKGAALLVMVFGALMLFDINLFKRFNFFHRLQSTSKGRWSGLVLGLTLGLVWIPCVGPILSGVLALVATQGQVLGGMLLLFAYSLGFAIPMLMAGYATQAFRQNIRLFSAHPLAVRLVSGLLLIAFGFFMLTNGMLGMTNFL